MRSMRYRFELEAGDEGYLIYNAETTWNAMPSAENLQRPSIRVKNVPVCGKIVADIASCVEPCDFYEGDSEVESATLSLHRSFKSNYVRILRGELPNWVLGVVQIDDILIKMAFFDRETGQEEDLYVNWTPWLKFMFEVDREDGSGVDTYLVKMSTDDQDTEKDRHLEVIEQDTYGKRKLLFTPLYDEPDGPDEHWKYVRVTEYR